MLEASSDQFRVFATGAVVATFLLSACTLSDSSDPVKGWLGCKTARCRAELFLYPDYPDAAGLEKEVSGIAEMLAVYEEEFGPAVNCKKTEEPPGLYSCGLSGGEIGFAEKQLATKHIRTVVYECRPQGRPAYFLLFKESSGDQRIVQLGFGLHGTVPGANAIVQRAVQRIVDEIVNPQLPPEKRIGTVPSPEKLMEIQPPPA